MNDEDKERCWLSATFKGLPQASMDFFASPAFRGSTTQSAGVNARGTITLEDMVEALRKIKDITPPVSDMWILIDPHGNAYKGKADDLLRILMREHPLLKTSFKVPYKEEIE